MILLWWKTAFKETLWFMCKVFPVPNHAAPEGTVPFRSVRNHPIPTNSGHFRIHSGANKNGLQKNGSDSVDAVIGPPDRDA
ncbi:hypothetical protein [Beijerinckia sp. L45]|uniref:hypothetical protein n=1 Tax=Beijerinckia sp. L45 TaxID=1641855 RepID=UPI00131D9843|nr:hypothetical protein [Beijerinckia sp. L45]